VVAADIARLLQRAHPAQAGRGRYADAAGQLDIGHAAVVLQFGEDLAVDWIELGVGHHVRPPRRMVLLVIPCAQARLAQFYFATAQHME
jgi:hypothetical protein